MAAAYGKLFVCCRDGSVIALNASKELEGPEDNAKLFRGPLFVEEFNGLVGGGAAFQPGTGRALKHSARVAGWDARGFNAIHAVQRSDKTWALQILATEKGHNTLTLRVGIAANEKGQMYTMRFQAGPTVYGDPKKATRKDDRFAIELLRPDGSMLKQHVVAPGAWAGRETFTRHTFNYQGDGSGDLRLRISPVPTGEPGFTGAISHLQVF